jgi:putative Mg2+ transporter-C (MgtC) family protein
MSDVALELAGLLRVLLATALAAAVGWERERAARPAGLRTHMTVGLAAATITTLSQELVQHASSMGRQVTTDPTRVLEAVVTGVAFLGAGTIVSGHRGRSVLGLTTAASLLATATIGVAAAAGAYVLAIGCTAMLLVVLHVFARLEPGSPDDDAHGERP